MAGTSNDIDLKPFIIKDRLQEKQDPKNTEGLPAGSYGFIYEVKVGDMLCVAKKPHTALLTNVSEAGKKAVVENFKKECLVLSKLRHPNIVPFIGVYYGSNKKDDIAMVMMKMESDLVEFIEKSSSISDTTKLSILQDVSYGLVYLHECNPPIIHRDLTARNILLTAGFRAKIADVGVAKLLDQATLAAKNYTTAPGNSCYMPPEALMEEAVYTIKLDIFSYGHLCLYVWTEKFPKVFEINITPSMLRQGIVQKLKRQSSIDEVPKDSALYALITKCLSDKPDRRPTTRELNMTMIQIVGVSSEFEWQIYLSIKLICEKIIHFKSLQGGLTHTHTYI